jgi:S1-C subfamily serine protease
MPSGLHARGAGPEQELGRWEPAGEHDWGSPDLPVRRRPDPERPRRSLRSSVLAILLAVVAGGVSGAIVALALDANTGAEETTLRPAAEGVPPMGRILTRVQESVVRIDVFAFQVPVAPLTMPILQESTGTGFVIDSGGLVATAAHVIAGATEITVTLQDGSTVSATVLGSDTDADLAVIRVGRGDLAPLALGSSAEMLLGEQVLAVGHALALEGAPTVSLGILSAIDRSITLSTGEVVDHLLQTDAAINAGDSGGPLINMAGEAIGINTAKVSTDIAENMGFAIAMDEALPVLEALRAGPA